VSPKGRPEGEPAPKRVSAEGSAASEAAAALRERVRAHLDRGAPWDACDAFREAEPSDDAEWLFLGALAHARAGAVGEAHVLLDRAAGASAAASTALHGEILALRGRLWKDALQRAHDDVEARTSASHARDEYLAAYAIARDPFPGINAATLSMVLDERNVARKLAAEVEATLASRGQAIAGWDLLTAAEAALLRDDVTTARERFAAAWSESPHDPGRIASARRQLRLLARTLPAANELLPVLRAPDVVAFTGHMIDTHDRAEPRFPAALEPAVAAALRERVARWHAPVVFASAACGADILMLEAALDAGAEVNIVLPFPRDEFVRNSVAPGGAGWVTRFDAALARASRVILATTEGHLGDDVLYEYAALLVEGLATLRATQLETAPLLVAVLEPGSPAHTGGTRHAVERWRGAGGTADVIDLSALRTGTRPVVRAHPAANAPKDRTSHSRRTLKSMLFADIAGYSRLRDEEVPRFQRIFWDLAARELAGAGKPLLANTWGDAVFAVFDAPQDAAACATRLRDAMQAVDWRASGLLETTAIRIALHAAPVFSGHDPVIGRENYFGAGVTRAARIEPVTPPGLVYASEAFAATLAAQDSHWMLEYVGTLKLAKQYGESRLYRLESR
jgi:class 3 adenylate cyclase